MRRRFASLTSRLVLTAVALVVVVALLIGAATALAMRSYLTSRLDAEVSQAVRRAAFIDGPGGPGGPGGGPLVVDRDDDGDTDVGYDLRQQSGTLVAELDGDSPSGIVLTEEAGAARPLSDAALDALAQLPSDGEVRGVVLPSFGSFRVAATEGADGVVRVNGLPTTDVDDAVGSLVRVELLLALLGVLVSAAAGTVV
ncbi:MAG: hypothetical protein F2667_05610, partial [Actinobacteria bacterium]|nr:hypothetical protein [Actinomycetota bacterium]